MDGGVPLPTLGRLSLGPEQGGLTSARLIIDRDVVQFQAGENRWQLATSAMIRGDIYPLPASDNHQLAQWQGTRVLRASGVSVLFEDGDPYRDCYGQSVAPRLSREQFHEWQWTFAKAWTEIETRFPSYAPAIMAGLTVLVPLVSGPEPDDIRAAERHAFGAVGVPQADPAVVGRRIVAAFQRAKLDAILDLFDLFDPHGPDAQPITSLLAEAYVELAVGEKDGAAVAIEKLSGRAALTPVGHRFVAEMRQSAAVLGYV